MQSIGTVDYYKCVNCGFVASKTHGELDESRWSELNRQVHHHIENPHGEKKGNQPPYAEQAMMLRLLQKNAVIETERIIDYAGGYGTLSGILAKYFAFDLPVFDPFIQTDTSGSYIKESELNRYQTVINSAMFEHVLKREDLDRVNDLVEDDGCLVIHSVICENVPNDPNWFYLRVPVHTAFHTNKSMEVLMNQWQYRSSLYCPPSKCWVLLKKPVEKFETQIAALNRELQTDWFYCKNGFVDYWKGF